MYLIFKNFACGCLAIILITGVTGCRDLTDYVVDPPTFTITLSKNNYGKVRIVHSVRVYSFVHSFKSYSFSHSGLTCEGPNYYCAYLKNNNGLKFLKVYFPILRPSGNVPVRVVSSSNEFIYAIKFIVEDSQEVRLDGKVLPGGTVQLQTEPNISKHLNVVKKSAR